MSKPPPQFWCNGACDQGRKCCPAPEACEMPEATASFVNRLLYELTPVAVIFAVVLLAFLVTRYFS